MEAYHHFYREVLSGKRVFAFRVDGQLLSETLGKGGLVRTFLFWSSRERALLYQQQTEALRDCEVVEFSLDEFCTKTLDSLKPAGYIVTIAMNSDKTPGVTGYNRGIDALRAFLDHFRLHKEGEPPFPGFWGGSFEQNDAAA